MEPVILLIWTAALVPLAGIAGYYFGRYQEQKKDKTSTQKTFTYDPSISEPSKVFGFASDNLKEPVIEKKKPTKSAVLKFPDPKVARARREQKIIDEAERMTQNTERPKGSFVI